MRWLVTVDKSADIDTLIETIQRFGGEPDPDSSPVPLGDNELILMVSGPSTLDRTLQSITGIIGVYPDSEMELY